VISGGWGVNVMTYNAVFLAGFIVEFRGEREGVSG